MTRNRTIALLCILLMVVGVALYTQLQNDCRQIVDTRLKDGLRQDPNKMAGWVATNYFLGGLGISKHIRGRETLLEWSTVGKLYRVVMNDEVKAVYQLPRFSYLSMRKVISCFGQPDFYAGASDLSVDYYQFHVSLIYPEDGYIFASRWVFAGDKMTTEVNIDEPLFVLVAVQPGSAEEMLQNAYSPDVVGEQILFDSIDTLQVWPRNYEALPLKKSRYRSSR